MPSSTKDVAFLENSNLLQKRSISSLKSYLVSLDGTKEPLSYYSFIKACRAKKYLDLAKQVFNIIGDKTELRSSFANESKNRQWCNYLLSVVKRVTSVENMVLLTMGSYNGKYDVLNHRINLDEYSELARALKAGLRPKHFFNITYDRVAHEANIDLGIGNNYFGDFWDVSVDPKSEMIPDLKRTIGKRVLVVHMDTQQKVGDNLRDDALRTMGYLLEEFPNNTIIFVLNVILKLGITSGTYKPKAAYWYFRNSFQCLKSRGMKMLNYKDSTTNSSGSEMGCFYFLFKR